MKYTNHQKIRVSKSGIFHGTEGEIIGIDAEKKRPFKVDLGVNGIWQFNSDEIQSTDKPNKAVDHQINVLVEAKSKSDIVPPKKQKVADTGLKKAKKENQPIGEIKIKRAYNKKPKI